MPLISSSIPNLVNGVSQQPFTLRLASQAETQENGLSTTAQGLQKRPPTEHIKRLGDRIDSSAYIHTINRDQSERYEVILTNGGIAVYDMAGEQKTVYAPNGLGYLSAADPSSAFRAITVADYTFILNKNVTVQADTTKTLGRAPEGLVVIRAGQYGKYYTVYVDGVIAANYLTPDGSASEHSLEIAPDHIASQLRPQLEAFGMTVTQFGATLHVARLTDFTMITSDGLSGATMFIVKDRAQRFSDLPANAANGFVVEIVGDVNTSGDNYWVRFESGSSGGVWRETGAPNVDVGLINGTMPSVLTRNADGSFTFRETAWGGRIVGDMESAPNPSFVGKRIRDIFFYRNRLGLLADEAVIFSGAGSFFNFFPTTVAQLLDSDPIDASVSHSKVSILNFAVTFNKELLLFSDQTQFAVSAGELLTAKTISIKPTTEFECSSLCAPEGVGRNVYFAVPRGKYEGVREYFLTSDSATEDASEITSHVPRYIPKGVYKIAAALNEDFLACLTKAQRNVIYAYKFYWSNNEKLQSSWSKWVFPATDEILSVEFIESQMYLVINRADGLYLERLGIAAQDPDAAETYIIHLDRKAFHPANFGSYANGYTQLTLGWNLSDGNYAAVVAEGQPKKAGTILSITPDGKVAGDYSNCALVVGRRYSFRYKFSPLMVRTDSGQGQKADTVGRLQIRKVQFNFAETGYFQVNVTPQGRSTYTYKYTGKTLGVDSATIGEVGIEDGSFSVPVQSQNLTVDIEVLSDSPLPMSLLSADWEGFYVRRSQAV